jgi:signal transduction histidine kinase
MKLSMPLFKQAAERIFEPALRNVEYFQRRLSAFAIFAFVMFPLYYVVWHKLFPQSYENLGLRLLGSALFVPLIFSKHWPDSFKRYLPYYWYFVLLYALPFFFTFMLLKNNVNEVWINSSLVAIFVMIFLLDWITLIAHCLLGTGLAILAFTLTVDTSLPPFERYDFLAIFLFAIVIGAISNYDSERIRIEQERAMLATAGSIAHELRTPLLSIRAGASGIANYLPTLLHAYQLARQHQLPVTTMRSAHLNALEGVVERIDHEANHANAIIDMLLINVREYGNTHQPLVPCSISQCVDMALARYPFSEQERDLVTWHHDEDFSFLGVELLAVHVLFNLMKNALRHIAQADKGHITIHLETSSVWNRLVFRDTGGGIPPEALAHIFMRFYSSSSNSELGAGIGLAFCRDVMDTFGGTIHCNSTHGEYCEFVLTFPTV